MAYASRNDQEDNQVALMNDPPLESARKERISPKNTVKKIQTKSANEEFKVHFEENITTKQLGKTRLSTIETDNVEIYVDDGKMEKRKKYFSTEHFLSFNVKLPLIRSEVRRKDEDFDLLQKYLVKQYPNVIVPTTKAHKANRYNEQKYITKRSYILQRFLREVLRSRILRGDSHLMTFLTESDNKHYLKALQMMNKQEKVTAIEDIITQDGRLTLTIPYVEEIRKVLQSKVRPAAD